MTKASPKRTRTKSLKALYLGLVCTLLCTNTSAFALPFQKKKELAMTMHSHPSEVQDSANNPPSPSGTLLKGEITYLVPRGTPIKLKLASVPSTGLKLMDRDLEGKLPPAQVGQPITAKVTEDIWIGENKVIPVGTIFYGKVSEIFPPKRAGRPGHLAISYNYFKTPDGRKFAFRAEANNYKPSTKQTKIKATGQALAHAAGGAATGAIIAYQLFGLEQTVAMHGYNIAGAAAAGALLGTAYYLLHKGQQAVLEPGDDFNMEIDTDMLMPAAVEPKKAKPHPTHDSGVQIKVKDKKIVKDGMGGNLLRLEVLIINNSKRTLNSIDCLAIDDNDNECPLATGLDYEAEYLFHISPYSMKEAILNFQVEYPKLKHSLVWRDHEKQHEILRQRLP